MAKDSTAQDSSARYGTTATARREHYSGTGAAITQVLGSPRFWVAPLLLVVIVMSLMASLYLGAIADPEENLHDFPIALVNEDRGGEITGADGSSTPANFGDQIAEQVMAQAREGGIAMDRMDRGEAFQKLNSGEIYGILAINPDFTSRTVVLGQAAVLENRPAPPTITVFINRGSGTFASAVTTTFAERVEAGVNAEMGRQLSETVRGQLTQMDLPFTGAAQLALADPVSVNVVEPTLLPEGAGNGLSAFYFTLLIILAGFTGAMMVSIMVDGLLGQTPFEYGPFYQLRVRLAISRWATLAAKWVIMFGVALVQSALFLIVCAVIGTEVRNTIQLWVFSALCIFAVGVSASAMIAAFGNSGLILNLIFFIALGLPSSGGTLPLEASPRIYTWLAAIEPMHVIYLGVRSILYFDADWGAGLARSVLQTLLGLLIGLLLGIGATKFYDRKGWDRYPGGMQVPSRLVRILDGGGSPTITQASPAHITGHPAIPAAEHQLVPSVSAETREIPRPDDAEPRS